jgi:tetratricopeptide (TPR) repeat protein
VPPAAILAGIGIVLLLGAFLLRSGDGGPTAAFSDPTPSSPASPGALPSTGAPAGGGPPALSGDMRANADGLFDRIMRELSAGDTARARFFAPMAMDAYRMAGDLDADGRYHLSLIQAIAEEYAAARETAESILAQNPNHLLGLAAAAAAAEGEGDDQAALAYHRRFLDALPSERERGLPEYQDHARILPEYEAAARAAVEG